MDKSERAGQSYRPSNGTEGEYFIDEYCMNCLNCDPDPEGKKQCDILMRSLFYDEKDPEYPTEWVYDKDGDGICTAYKKWNWDLMGNPDDPDNPNYYQAPNPNQISLF